jgi:xanthine/CO dehydrogenase XdhC/CoxF family maturation factor
MADALAAIVQGVLEAINGGEAVVSATVVSAPPSSSVEPGMKMLVRRDGSTVGSLGSAALEQTVRRLAEEAFPEHSAGSAFLLEDGREVRRGAPQFDQAAQVLIEVIEAPAVLLVVGAGHIGR